MFDTIAERIKHLTVFLWTSFIKEQIVRFNKIGNVIPLQLVLANRKLQRHFKISFIRVVGTTEPLAQTFQMPTHFKGALI